MLDLTPEESIEDEIVQADETKERLYAALSKFHHCWSFLGCTPPTTPPVMDAPTADPRCKQHILKGGISTST